MEKEEIKRSLVPTFHQIGSVHHNHPSCHGHLHPANPLLVIFLHTVETAKSIKPEKHHPSFPCNTNQHKRSGEPRPEQLNQTEERIIG
jgi:hypothetical protein